MKIIENINEIEKPYNNAVVTIGNFDGVHIGHQALLHTVIEKADAINGTSIAMTFNPHPIRVLAKNGQPPLITLPEQKAELIARAGIQVLIIVPFTKDFATLGAHEFIKSLLVEKIGMKAIVVGKDYTFGRNKEGDLNLLREISNKLNFDIILVDWIQASNGLNRRISSTKVRELVMNGKMDDAKKILGRYYQIRGTVAGGRNRGGKLLGFPTANINLHDELCPKRGIYAVTVEHGGKSHLGVANIGYSPTFDDHIFTVEVHILDFDKNIYGDRIRVNFIERLRDEKKFKSIEALAGQIRKDIIHARKILAGAA
ncbi:MAG: bifunctional riboflavin kinase/FAD synthetase [Desulfobacteraceae bacterium]|nr:bifunctional riboflavin kinase/FAD synthetase [Desulfobacteraceae bacterium]